MDMQKATQSNIRHVRTVIDRRKMITLATCGVVALTGACARGPALVPTDIGQKLSELGVSLPVAGKAVATYAPFRIVRNMVYIAGQGPLAEPNVPVLGKVGKDLTIEQGQYAARLACYNILAQAKAACGGDLNKIVQWVKMGGFVNCTAEFTDHPKVINGATDLLRDVFGDKGLPARFAVGVNSLPFNICVEIDASFEIRT